MKFYLHSLHLILRLDLCSNASFITLVTRFTKFYSNMAIYFNYLINLPEKWHHFAHVTMQIVDRHEMQFHH